MSEIKRCTECRFYTPRVVGPLAFIPHRCFHPELVSVTDGRGAHPDIERGPLGRCKIGALKFEAKPKRFSRQWWRFWA